MATRKPLRTYRTPIVDASGVERPGLFVLWNREDGYMAEVDGEIVGTADSAYEAEVLARETHWDKLGQLEAETHPEPQPPHPSPTAPALAGYCDCGAYIGSDASVCQGCRERQAAETLAFTAWYNHRYDVQRCPTCGSDGSPCVDCNPDPTPSPPAIRNAVVPLGDEALGFAYLDDLGFAIAHGRNAREVFERGRRLAAQTRRPVRVLACSLDELAAELQRVSAA